MNRPWMPLYVADYLADTTHLSAAEHGAYLLLIMHYWQQGSLPTEGRQLARIARMSPEEWADARPSIASFFDANWRHARIDAEIATAEEKYAKRAKAGQKGGKAKASASNATALPEQCLSETPSKTEAGLNQPQPHTQKEIITISPDEVSPLDPFLNSDDPFVVFSENEVDGLQFDFDTQDIRRDLPGVWEWSGRQASKLNERKALVYQTFKNRKAKADLLAAKANAPPVQFTAELAGNRLTQTRLAPRFAR